jgi:hypothetical protein
MSDVNVSKPTLGLQTIAGAIGAIVGVLTTVFGAGIYYQSLASKMNDYMNKIDTNEKVLQATNSDLLAVKSSVSTLASFNSDLARGRVDVIPPDGTLCPAGSYVQGIHAFSQSGGEHGQVYAVTVECRKFSSK